MGELPSGGEGRSRASGREVALSLGGGKRGKEEKRRRRGESGERRAAKRHGSAPVSVRRGRVSSTDLARGRSRTGKSYGAAAGAG